MQRHWRRMGLERRKGSAIGLENDSLVCKDKYRKYNVQFLDRPSLKIGEKIGVQLCQRSVVLAARCGFDALFAMRIFLDLAWLFRFRFLAATRPDGQQHRRPFLPLPMTNMGEDRDADVRQEDEGGKVVCKNAVEHDG